MALNLFLTNEKSGVMIKPEKSVYSLFNPADPCKTLISKGRMEV
jgi:hypothetical protein